MPECICRIYCYIVTVLLCVIVGLSDLPDSPKFKEGKSEPKDCNPEGGGVHIKQTIIQLICVCRILFHVLMASCGVNSHPNQQHFS